MINNMNESMPEKDLIIDTKILTQTAINLSETRRAGLISDTRWDELRTLGKELAATLGDKSHLAISSSMILTPHIMKAIADLKKSGATDLPKQPVRYKLTSNYNDAMLHEQEERAEKLRKQDSDA